MAGPSSTRDRDRERSGVHHHHRTISSTTLLLILSLVLAVLAVLLSIPNRSSGNALNPEQPGSGLWGYLTPRRSQVLVAREGQVALREAEVARREAELLAGQPGGLTIASCEPCPVGTPFNAPPVHTIIQEFTREVEPIPSPAPPAVPAWWKEVETRLEGLLDRELKVNDREKDVGRREEVVNRREHEAGRRETWVMEQLLNIGTQPHDVETEEIIYETRKAKPKELPSSAPVAPSASLRTMTITRTLFPNVPEGTPAHTRVAAPPSPEDFSTTTDGPPVGRTRKPHQVIEVIEEEVVEETPSQAQPEKETETVYVRERPGYRGWW